MRWATIRRPIVLSVSQDSLNGTRKHFHAAERYAENVQRLHDHGIGIQACFVFGSDDEDESEMRESSMKIQLQRATKTLRPRPAKKRTSQPVPATPQSTNPFIFTPIAHGSCSWPMGRLRQVQECVLNRIVTRNRDTWFGRRFGLASVRNAQDFQNAVPLSGYDDYRDAIERIAGGERNVLTADRVRLLQPTSGSTSGEKLIPFTTALEHSLHRANRVWIWDLFTKRPAVRRGPSYWSISLPAETGRMTKAGIPIGFENDAEYLGRWERYFAQKTIIAPAEIVRSPSISAAQFATLLFLLRARKLSLISVWSPTFLTELLKLLWAKWELLANVVAIGRMSSNERHSTRPLPDRAEELRGIFRNASDISQCIHAIWPFLALVSCWADAPLLVHTNNLRQYLPGIEIQPKGLLATEAFVTVPLVLSPAPALAIRSHFFEFSNGRCGKRRRQCAAASRRRACRRRALPGRGDHCPRAISLSTSR